MIAMASSHNGARTVVTEAWDATGLHVHRKGITHMAFFWGHKTQVLFPGWPGSSTDMYVLALAFVFSLAVIVEWLTHCNFVKPGASRVAAGLFKTGLHGVRTGLAYMVVLAVMSFNGGIFIAAVIGHAVGYLLFGSRVVFNKSGKSNSDSHEDSDLPVPPPKSGADPPVPPPKSDSDHPVPPPKSGADPPVPPPKSDSDLPVPPPK